MFRRGLTLIEVAVVIVILVILAGLLIPPTTINWGAARRNQCSVNQKNHSLAMIQHEMAKGSLPGYLHQFGFYGESQSNFDPSSPTTPAEQLRPHRKIGGWAVAVLPWLEAQPTYEHWTEDRYPIVHFDGGRDDTDASGYTGFAAPNLAIFQCPDDWTIDGVFASNSYVANTGLCGQVRGSTLRFNGVIHNRLKCLDSEGNLLPPGPAMRLDDFTDGQGFTALVTESLHAMPWHRVGFLTSADLHADVSDSLPTFPPNASLTQGFCWRLDLDDRRRVINSSDSGDDMTPTNAASLAVPSSAHVEGVNVGFADGATRFIGESIDGRVYRAMMTPCDTKSDSPTPNFKLTDQFTF